MTGQIQSAATKAGIRPELRGNPGPDGSRRYRHFSALAKAIFRQMTRMWTRHGDES
jgi:hypothetical protein